MRRGFRRELQSAPYGCGSHCRSSRYCGDALQASDAAGIALRRIASKCQRRLARHLLQRLLRIDRGQGLGCGMEAGSKPVAFTCTVSSGGAENDPWRICILSACTWCCRHRCDGFALIHILSNEMNTSYDMTL